MSELEHIKKHEKKDDFFYEGHHSNWMQKYNIFLSYRTNYRIILFVVQNVIKYLILANTLSCIVKTLINFVSLANRMAIIYSVL